MSRAPGTIGLLALLLLSWPASAQPRKIYLHPPDDEDLVRLARLEDALSGGEAARAAVLLDELLDSTSRPAGARLVETSEFFFRGLRARALDLALQRPEVAQALRGLQAEGATQALRGEDAPGPARLWRRYPLSPQGAQAAETLWSRSLACGDLCACALLAADLGRLHPERLQPPRAQARLAELEALRGEVDSARTRLARLRAQPPGDGDGPEWRALLGRVEALLARARPAAIAAVTPPPDARLVEVSSAAYYEREEEERRDFSPAMPSWHANRVAVSNGACLALFDLLGQRVSSLPLATGALADAPLSQTGFQGRVSWLGEVGYAPLVLERWLAPGRVTAGADDALGNRFFSLAAFATSSGRLLWWDGDAGPRGEESLPPGWSEADQAMITTLRRGHVLSVVADERRIYLALTVKGEEPDLLVMAYEPCTGRNQPLVLRPAWPAATPLLSAERTSGGSDDDGPVAPEVAACLAVDGRGRLLCTTDVGLAACLSTQDGELLWAHRARPDPDAEAPGFRFRASPRQSSPRPPEPAGFLPQDRAAFLCGRQLTVASLADGALVWRRDVGDDAHRLLVLEQTVLTYGGADLQVFSHDGTQLQSAKVLQLGFPCVGAAARQGSCLIFPTLKRRDQRPVLRLDRYDVGPAGTLTPNPRESVALSRITDPVNLATVPGGLVAASHERVVFLRWE